MTTYHTPTPWTQIGLGIVADPVRDGRTIAKADPWDFGAAHANAALIVRAVNAHDALVSALERTISDLNASVKYVSASLHCRSPRRSRPRTQVGLCGKHTRRSPIRSRTHAISQHP